MLRISAFTVGAILTGSSAPLSATPAVAALYESPAFPATDGRADADDPAIWRHPRDRSRSIVVATLKNGGLVVLDLRGRVVQRLAAPPAPRRKDEPGRFNNVDLILGMPLDGKATDIAVVSDRGRDRLVLYSINPEWSESAPPLRDITASDAPWVFSTKAADVEDQRTAYGLATHRQASGDAIGFISQRERARIAKVRFFDAAGGKASYTITNTYTFPASFRLSSGRTWTPCLEEDSVEPQFEGMVIDPEGGHLYAAQETVGVWRMNLDGGGRTLVERVRSFGVSYVRARDDDDDYACELTSERGEGGVHLTADAEGLTIYQSPSNSAARYLIASSQGDDSFSIWNIRGGAWSFKGSFTIAFNGDKNENADGAHVTAIDLGPDYPRGLLVTQDGVNTPEIRNPRGKIVRNTNFKFTPLDRVIKALNLD